MNSLTKAKEFDKIKVSKCTQGQSQETHADKDAHETDMQILQ